MILSPIALAEVPGALAAVRARLGLQDAQLAQVSVARRGYDARRKRDIQLVYTVDCALAAGVDEAALLARLFPKPQGACRVAARERDGEGTRRRRAAALLPAACVWRAAAAAPPQPC